MIIVLMFIFSISLLIFYKDIYPLKYNKSKKEIIVLSFIAFFAISLAILMAFGIKIPSPMEGLDSFVKDVLKLNYKN
jgi:hypothetical protein